jgi:hypothetical protein
MMCTRKGRKSSFCPQPMPTRTSAFPWSEISLGPRLTTIARQFQLAYLMNHYRPAKFASVRDSCVSRRRAIGLRSFPGLPRRCESFDHKARR